MKNMKGFSLMGVIVAMALVLIGGAIVTPILLKHIKDGAVAAVVEEIKNVEDALLSAVAKEQGPLPDLYEGDYMMFLVKEGYLEQYPQSLPGGHWYVGLEYDAVKEQSFYYLAWGCETEACSDLIVALDEKVDHGDKGETGMIVWTDVP